MIELYLVRHGETEENVAQILQGHLPGHLTALGRQQAIQLAERLNKEHITFDALLCSDLQRTIDTATIIKNHLNQNVTITPCPLLRERDWGRSTGTAISIARSEGIASDAESINDMYRRALQFLSKSPCRRTRIIQPNYTSSTIRLFKKRNSSYAEC